MILVLCALDREAVALRRLSSLTVQVHVIGMGASAETRVRELILAERPTLVISAGLCGGLHPDWPVGRVVVPSEVLDRHGNTLHTNACANSAARLLTIDQIVLCTEAKQALRAQFAADVVDMEAAMVACVSAEHGVPFLAIKAISDDATTSLPSELPTVAPHGRPHWRRLVGAMLRRPSLMFELMRLGVNTNRALAALADNLTHQLRS